MSRSGKTFPTRLRGELAALEKKIEKKLGEGSYSPDDVPTSPLCKALIALSDEKKMAMIMSLCERIAWQIESDDWSGVVWHTNEILEATFGRKKLPWSAEDVETIAGIAASLGDDYDKLPMQKIVPMIESAETISTSLRNSIKTLAKQMRAAESVPHNKLAKRLSALL